MLTLGDNRKVDFSKAMIFMTSNLGALEMNALTSPQFGCDPGGQAEAADGKLNERLAHSSIAAARRKFMPEFINRLDKIVTFKPLLSGQLMEILEIELRAVQQRIVNASPQRPFVVELTEAAKELLLREGTDRRYGARHLKRAIERLLVQPLCNLMATHQVRAGDCLRADWESSLDHLTFVKQADVLSCPANIEPAGRALPERSRAAGKDILSDTVANEQLFRAG